MERTTNNYVKLKGQMLATFAARFTPTNPGESLKYLTDKSILNLLATMLPGQDVSAFIFSDGLIRGSHKFTTKWEPQDLDVLLEILRLGFVAGMYYDKRTSNRSRANNRNSA